MATLSDLTPPPRTVVCVTGMHRSGTSLAARSIELLGVSLGRPEGLLDPGPDNEAGYWENEAIKELDDVLLADLGGSWDVPPTLAPGWEASTALDEHRRRAGEVLRDAFGSGHGGGPIGFKDPRLSLLLPFWRTVTPITTTIVVVRDPVEVAHSLGVRNAMGPSQAALLWLRYLFAATGNDPGHLLVTQSAFFDDLPATLSRIAGHLGLPEPTAAVVDEAASHLDPALRHHRSPPRPTPDDPPLAHMAEEVWNDGAVVLDALPPTVRAAIAEGWLRDPADSDLLAASRAEVVALTKEIRQRNRQRDASLSWRLRLRVRAARRWVEGKTGR